MGRFTSVQGFADNNSNNRSITYDQAKGNEDGKKSDGDKQKLVTEKVVNPYGSTSGAGSGEFHVYRHARAREMARWNALDLEAKEKREELDFRASIEDDRKQRETKASKNRKKRQREKEAKRRKKFMKAAGIDLHQPSTTTKNNDGKSNEEEEEFTYISVAQQQQQQKERDEKKESRRNEIELSAAGSSSSYNNNDLVIPEDGSFLEMMKRKLREEKEQQQQQQQQQRIPTTGTKHKKSSDKIDKHESSFGDEKVIDAQVKNAEGVGGGSDEEGPALPPS